MARIDRNPNAPAVLVDAINAGEIKAASDIEQMMLLHEELRLQNEKTMNPFGHGTIALVKTFKPSTGPTMLRPNGDWMLRSKLTVNMAPLQAGHCALGE